MLHYNTTIHVAALQPNKNCALIIQTSLKEKIPTQLHNQAKREKKEEV
jgi:hypothetical protein